MDAFASTCQTADGPFSIIADSDSILASGWTGNLAELVALIHSSLRPSKLLTSSTGTISKATQAVEAFYDNDFTATAAIPILQYGSPFHRSAWDALHQVPPGVRLTYAALAERAGNPKAVRAAGAACAFNAIALFVPCHRIVRTNGNLGGFRYGLKVKQSLLDREAVV